MIIARATLISIMLNLCPMHIRGPRPKAKIRPGFGFELRRIRRDKEVPLRIERAGTLLDDPNRRQTGELDRVAC